MRNQKIQKLRAQWFAFKTNRFYLAGLRSGAKRGLIAAIIFLLGLNPLIWILFGNLYSFQDKNISLALIIFSTALVFSGIFVPLFMFIGTGLGLWVARRLEKYLADWSKTKFVFRNLAIFIAFLIIIVLLIAIFIFNLQDSESLFNFILMILGSSITLIGLVWHLSALLFQRALNGDL